MRRSEYSRPGTDLTDLERRVLYWTANGDTDETIARRLFYGRTGIQAIQQRIKQKLGAANRAHAVALGFRRGYLKDEVKES